MLHRVNWSRTVCTKKLLIGLLIPADQNVGVCEGLVWSAVLVWTESSASTWLFNGGFHRCSIVNFSLDFVIFFFSPYSLFALCSVPIFLFFSRLLLFSSVARSLNFKLSSHTVFLIHLGLHCSQGSDAWSSFQNWCSHWSDLLTAWECAPSAPTHCEAVQDVGAGRGCVVSSRTGPTSEKLRFNSLRTIWSSTSPKVTLTACTNLSNFKEDQSVLKRQSSVLLLSFVFWNTQSLFSLYKVPHDQPGF